MDLRQLIDAYRLLAHDRLAPYFCDDDALAGWLNEAEQQACVRGRLLLEESDQDVCHITLARGQAVYPLHPKLYEIVSARITTTSGRPRCVRLVSREWLDANIRDWRTQDGPVVWAVQGETSIRLSGEHEDGDSLDMDVYRLPLQDMVLPSDPPTPGERVSPEIHEASHSRLVQWALYRAFSIPDAELFDPTRSEQARMEFERYFGPLPDSDMRRITREDVPHHNELVLP